MSSNNNVKNLLNCNNDYLFSPKTIGYVTNKFIEME